VYILPAQWKWGLWRGKREIKFVFRRMEKQFNTSNENTRLVKSAGNFLERRGTITFSGRTLLFIELQNFRFMIFWEEKHVKNEIYRYCADAKLTTFAPGAFIAQSECQYYGTSASFFLQTANKGIH